ncbi:MAG: SDR family oxidoreductase [Chitinophagales bacterium]|nr:SDR family oxidoreductase [Chitinophagales bacterium]
MNIKGKLAIVTGASSGIGLATVHALLENGCRVAGWSRRDPNIDHPEFYFVPVDIQDSVAVAKAMEETLAEFGNVVDILVNNAGIGIFDLMENLSLEDWQTMFNTNVNGLFYATRLVLPLMKAEKRGHIVNIASIAGLNGIAEATGYCATKFAVRGISQALYQEVKKENIKVTCVYPGSVNTAFFGQYEGITANDTMLHPNDVADMIIHILRTPDNFNTLDVEIRPMNVRYS